jgi:basic amino acid/polyamine antiporter, APA family
LPPLATVSSSKEWLVHPRFGTPSTALIPQSTIASLLLLFIGRFQALFSLAIFSEWLAYGLTASTIFVFRRRAASRTRPFSVPGYPVVPVVFIAAAIVLTIFLIEDQPINALGGAGVILCGIPVHLLYQRWRQAPAHLERSP